MFPVVAPKRCRPWRLALIAGLGAAFLPAPALALVPITCDATAYDAGNPDHVLYGRSVGTPVIDEMMWLDLTTSASDGGRLVVFWDGGFTAGSGGVVIVGSPRRDTICGTTGDDWIHGGRGSDRIFGFGSDQDYDRRVPGGGLLGDHLFGGKGHDLISNGTGVGFADLAASGALIGGGKGNDTLYSGDGSTGTPWVRGGVGDDTLLGGLAGSGHMLRGGPGDDQLNLWGLDDSTGLGNTGDDTLTSRWGVNLELDGGMGDDLLIAGWGDYLILLGGAGDDTLVAGSGAHQSLLAGAGDDILRNVGGGTDQLVNAGSGSDIVIRASGH